MPIQQAEVPKMIWNECVARLEQELPEKQLNTWIRPLQPVEEGQVLRLYAPNRFVMDWVREHYFSLIADLVAELSGNPQLQVQLSIGSIRRTAKPSAVRAPQSEPSPGKAAQPSKPYSSGLVPGYTFESFVEGKSNQLAHASALQVAANPGRAYNPLLIYGGVGLGKTHLMQAVGHRILADRPDARVLYVRSERFVADMVTALKHHAMNDFKHFYRSIEVLLVDDIQFIAGKDRSQEEFFHTFNELLEQHHQIVLTCDRYPKEVDGLEERLKSRFSWGLTQAIEPPELETRVAILQRKAQEAGRELDIDVAFFIGQRIRSHVRDLEGALNKVIAYADFRGCAITVDMAKEALRDQLAVLDKMITLEGIQRTVADYYNVRVADLLSKRRSRSITRPRQMAMALAKELTNHSLPEIGDAFGGRDHTTVLHACRKVRELRASDHAVEEDFGHLVRILTS